MCNHTEEIYSAPLVNPPCSRCGGQTERVWLSSFPNVIGDEIPGGMTIENLGGKTFYSKREIAAEAKRQGLIPKVQHVGEQGSDKSPHTTRWI